MHYYDQNAIRTEAGDNWREIDLIFPTIIGTAMHPTSMYKDFKKLLANYKLPNALLQT